MPDSVATVSLEVRGGVLTFGWEVGGSVSFCFSGAATVGWEAGDPGSVMHGGGVTVR